MRSAAHYADANRALIAELVRRRIREVFGHVGAPLVCDIPHNIVLTENGLNIHRKGSTPAHKDELLLIPGSMGDYSYLLSGMGNERWCMSASHGAGRAVSRTEMSWKAKNMDRSSAGSHAFECITLREERIVEEAPSAYKPIGPVIESQVNQRMVEPIARLAPIFTFKA
jgi:tRNA-splicing ligase RtcB